MGEVFKRGNCKAGEIYDKIIEIFEGAGWKNISADKTVDFDVMHSKGEEGDKDITIQLRPWATNATQDVRTTINKNAGMRLLKNYAPLIRGKINKQEDVIEKIDGVDTLDTRAVSTIDRPNAPWQIFWLSGEVTVNTESQVEYCYQINKNRLIIIIRHLDRPTSNVVVHYLGIPNEVYGDESGNIGHLWASSLHTTSSGVSVVDDVKGRPSNALVSNTVYSLLPSVSPNGGEGNGKYMLTTCTYGSATMGIRGRLTDLYSLVNSNILDKDIIKVDNETYEVAVTTASRTNSFPSQAFAYRIE